MKHKILFVDDEASILSSVRRVFLGSEYEILTAVGGEEGLSILNQGPVSIIVSDMRMPGMTGVEFLIKTMDICPDAVRMILSGYADVDTIISAINNGYIWRFIAKPWNDEDLKITVANALDLYDKKRERDVLLLRLRKINKLLEKKVEERTHILQERTRILHMIVEDKPIDDIVDTACQVISGISGGNGVVIKPLYVDKIFSRKEAGEQDGADPPAPPETLIQKVIESKKREREGQWDGYPISKKDTMLGVLLIGENDGKGGDKYADAVENIAALVSLALYQNRTIQEAPKLMKNIDKIMEIL